MPLVANKIIHSSTNGPADTITLPHDLRHRRRIALTSDNGTQFLLDLEHVTQLRHGDLLQLSDGRAIEVRAKPEPLLEVRGRDHAHMLKLAWHLGNRHLEAQIDDTRILVRPDHVIADMLIKLGAKTRDVEEPFNPEGGAYGGQSHSHGHTHVHRHHHEH